MTRDIIRMAREASSNSKDALLENGDDLVMLYLDELEHFAALVAAAEREECAKVCEKIATDTYGMSNLREYGECAAAIRARGTQ